MKKQILLLTIIGCLLSTACSNITNKTKQTLNEGGEAVGKTATEFIEGVSKGVENTLECEVILSDSLKEQGITTGAFEIENDTLGGKDNLLSIYLIFDKNITKKLTAKAYNKKGLEIGRANLTIKAKEGQADYYDFSFNSKTEIGVRSKVIIE